jgi:hypothetical protein
MTTLPGLEAHRMSDQGQILLSVRQPGTHSGIEWKLWHPDGSLISVPDPPHPDSDRTPRTMNSDAGPLLVRATGETVNLSSFLPSAENARIDFQGINAQEKIVGTLPGPDVSLDGYSSRTAFLLAPRELAPPLGSAKVTLSQVRTNTMDGSPFVVESVNGALLTPNYLEAEIVARPNARGTRRIYLSLRLGDSIEAGWPYPVAEGIYDRGPGGRVLVESPKDGVTYHFPQSGGVFILDKITSQEVVLRLVDIRLTYNGASYYNPDTAFRLNATLTLPR